MSGSVVLIIRIVLTIAVYGFVGWSIWALWSDLKVSSISTVMQSVPTIYLDNGIQQFKFSSPEIIIGRDQVNELPIQDKAISARHTRLSYHHGQWWVEDLKSRNGTFINEKQVLSSIVVTAGDKIKCATQEFQISFDE